MRSFLLLSLAALAPTTALAQGGPASPAGVAADVTMLRLRDGTIHWGAITEHGPDGFRFALLSHGGVVDVTWELLDPAQEKELRERFGYVDVSSEELMIDVEKLLLVDGGEVTGVVLSREGDSFLVKVDGNLQLVPKRRVKSISKGHLVPALDVYTREELYGHFLGDSIEDDPDSQYELAQRCELILDFQHAVEHYEKALELDPDGDAGDVAFALERARRKAEQQAQIDYLREVDVLRKRGKFDEALARLEAFETTFPESPLAQDARTKEQRVLSARDDAIRDLVRRRWNHWMRFLARQAAKMDYAEALAYAEEGLSQEIQEKVLEDVQRQVSDTVTAEQVLAFWATRRKVRYDNASYGLGTWMLGEDKARAGTEDEEEAEQKSEKDQERADLEEKIERFLKSQRAARRAREQADKEDEFQSFWATFPVDNRAQWIRAYYVEFGGDLELRDRPYLKACPACGGSGVQEIIHSGGGGQGGSGVQISACPTCHGVAVVRRVYYR